jgi:hypothetical protein
MQPMTFTTEEQREMIELLEREIPGLREAIVQATEDHAYRDVLREKERLLTTVLTKLQEGMEGTPS